MGAEIYVRTLVEVCWFFDAPALHTLRCIFNFWGKEEHVHFRNLVAGSTIIPRNWFPVLKRMEIHFRCADTQHVWNCSALKRAFEGYDDLEFVFDVPATDGPPS
jgi:hypothetical protein